MWTDVVNVRFFFVALQITLLPQNFSLHFNRTRSEDTGEYNCIVNDRHSPEEIIDLLVQGKYIYIYIMCDCRNKND